MGHINFHALAAPSRKKVERSFTDPALPGLTLTLLLEEPDALTDYAAAEVSAELVRRYLDGDPAIGMPPQPFVVGEEPRTLSPLLCDDVGRLVAMQAEGWADRYEPEEVLQMAFKAPGLWRQVRRWVREVYVGAAASLGEGSPGREATSSGPPSSGEASILASSTISVGRSGASTPGSLVVTG